MNLVNRIIVIVEALVAAILSVALLILILVNRGNARPVFEPLLNSLTLQNGNPTPVFLVAGLVLIFAVSILLLLLELRRPGPSRMRLQSVQGAEVLVASDAVTQQLEYTLDALTDVIRVKPHVMPGGKNKALDVMIELTTAADVDIQGKTQEVMGIARQVIEDRLGLKVGRVQIKLDQVRMPKKGSRSVVTPLRVAAPKQATAADEENGRGNPLSG